LTQLLARVTKRWAKDGVTAAARISAAGTLCALFALGVSAQATPPAQTASTTQSTSARKPAQTATTRATKRVTPPAAKATTTPKADQQLAGLASALHDKPTAANEDRLIAFQHLHAKDTDGSLAAIALGHYELEKTHPAEALDWFAAALTHPTNLDEYALFWRAQSLRQLNHNDQALQDLQTFRTKYPDSVMSDVAVQAFAEAALATGDAQRAAALLNTYERTPLKTPLLLLRAQAREKTDSLIAAATDYETIYYNFPLSDEARTASTRMDDLARQLGNAYPVASAAQQAARAEALYGAHRWRDAILEFQVVAEESAGADRDHAELRIAQCRSSLGGGSSSLVSVSFTTPDAEAERLYSLSQTYRSEKRDAEMFATIDQLASRFPQSSWTGEADFSAGNYDWVALDREHAADYYSKVALNFPSSENAPTAAWRAAWTAYLDRNPDAAMQLQLFIHDFPGSSTVPDALYWLGRLAEKGGNVPQARSYYGKDSQRFPQTFFGLLASAKVTELGLGPVDPADILSAIPDAPEPGELDAPIPPEAQDRWERAQNLRLIGLDSTAELELRAAYATTQAPRLLLEAASAAIAADQYAAGIALARQAYPQPESHQVKEMPSAVAKVLYPLPYLPAVSTAAAQNHLDPMLVAGVMRQESGFQPEAVSNRGAVGLMQLEPATALLLARRLRLHYARARLFDPQYNLQLGTLYLSDLINQFGGPEGALAAYNAGEDRSKLWQSERDYSEPAEFVESIPFSQTHDYVQIVMRNAAIYRMLNQSGSVSTHTAPTKSNAVKASSPNRAAGTKTKAAPAQP
jgi:soluble lytic murein transglycosylase